LFKEIIYLTEEDVIIVGKCILERVHLVQTICQIGFKPDNKARHNENVYDKEREDGEHCEDTLGLVWHKWAEQVSEECTDYH